MANIEQDASTLYPSTPQEPSQEVSTMLSSPNTPARQRIVVEGETALGLLRDVVSTLGVRQPAGALELQGNGKSSFENLSLEEKREYMEYLKSYYKQQALEKAASEDVVDAELASEELIEVREPETTTEPIMIIPSEPDTFVESAEAAVQDKYNELVKALEEKELKKKRRRLSRVLSAVVLLGFVGPVVHSAENGASAKEECELVSYWDAYSNMDTFSCFYGHLAVSSLVSIPRLLP